MINTLLINIAIFFSLQESNIITTRYIKVRNDTIILKIRLNIQKKIMNKITNAILLFFDFIGSNINLDKIYENPIKINDIKYSA